MQLFWEEKCTPDKILATPIQVVRISRVGMNWPTLFFQGEPWAVAHPAPTYVARAWSVLCELETPL